ncbi:MAG: O-methyltransferase [Prolixibacteraceae bacterium]
MLTDKKLEDYIFSHSEEEDEVLKELDRETNLHVLNPRMLSGHLQGKLLEMFSRMIGPEQVLEIGTYTGYSAICLARGLKEGGQLHTIEIDDELESIAGKYFIKAGLDDKIVQHIGPAVEIIPTLHQTFDLIFLDADKLEYCTYFDLVFDKLRPGGFILADNVLWNGKVLETPSVKDGQTLGIIQFNEKIKNDPRVSQVILPLRDGLMLIRKKEESLPAHS